MTQRTSIASIRLAVIAAAGIASTVLGADLSKYPASTKTGVTYATDIQPILKADCFKCHGDGPRFSGNLHLETLAGTLKGSKDGPVVTAGNSAESDLVLDAAGVGDHPMPPKPRARRPKPVDTNAPAAGMTPPPAQPAAPTSGPGFKKMTVEEVGLLRAWIDEGAK